MDKLARARSPMFVEVDWDRPVGDQQQRWRHNEAQLRKMAHAMCKRAHDPAYDVDDLVQAGRIGLWQASQRFDFDMVKRNDKDRAKVFSRFASLRVRGAMLDAVREASWTGRSASDYVRHCMNAYKRKTGGDLCLAAVDAEKFERVTGTSFLTFLRVSGAMNRAYLDLDMPVGEDGESRLSDLLPDQTAVSPFESAFARMRSLRMQRLVGSLPLPYNAVVAGKYWAQLTEREMGEMVGVSESAICHRARTAMDVIRTVLMTRSLQHRKMSELFPNRHRFGRVRGERLYQRYRALSRMMVQRVREFGYETLATSLLNHRDER